ncbi:MAG TPA: hypothetical protein VI758_05995 [Bacteroidota bacterium]
MKEFMLLILNQGDEKSAMSPDKHEEFVRACEIYIGSLKNDGKLIAAQPLVREGSIISGSKAGWNVTPFDPKKEIQVGYYHILAEDLKDAVAIAKGNPEFEYSKTARIEVRPVKTAEKTTGFVYPQK